MKAVPAICTLSPILRIAVSADGEAYKTLVNITAWIVQQIDGDAEVAASLKAPIAANGLSVMRQIDIRATPDSPVVVKTFIRWNHAHACWHVMIEGPYETHWERDQVDEGMN